ncbi:hypothetical protein LS482_07245 [Sinomicrobium kalidii]|uniref:hypothetical protein n=1 Tax=Sinomicrobium kalidii TaxID=2900738 RepID=UPI001E56E147|nr:hypothetical protein [Sinomicrobium kalidii]UGU17663.1 hypothetical protein LS482_07245 [Sinomicrobium kalidii]
MKKILITSGILLFMANMSNAQWDTNANGDVYALTNVGIGTSDPENALHIDKGELKISHDANAPTIRLYDSADGDQFVLRHHRNGDRFELRSDAGTLLSITKEGLVGIGSQNPDSKLTVNGRVHASAVKLSLNIPADYVFQKYYTGESDLLPEYTMPSLKEVEKFVKENHHLPGVPSAKELQEKGMDLAQMNNVLLRKIEELTLYIIEQEELIQQIMNEEKQ